MNNPKKSLIHNSQSWAIIRVVHTHTHALTNASIVYLRHSLGKGFRLNGPRGPQRTNVRLSRKRGRARARKGPPDDLKRKVAVPHKLLFRISFDTPCMHERRLLIISFYSLLSKLPLYPPYARYYRYFFRPCFSFLYSRHSNLCNV